MDRLAPPDLSTTSKGNTARARARRAAVPRDSRGERPWPISAGSRCVTTVGRCVAGGYHLSRDLAVLTADRSRPGQRRDRSGRAESAVVGHDRVVQVVHIASAFSYPSVRENAASTTTAQGRMVQRVTSPFVTYGSFRAKSSTTLR